MSLSNEKKKGTQDYGWKLKAHLLNRNQMHKATYYVILPTQNSRQGKAIETDNESIMTRAQWRSCAEGPGRELWG